MNQTNLQIRFNLNVNWLKIIFFYGKALSYVERAGNKVLHLHGLDADKVQFKYLTTDGVTWSKIEVQYMVLVE